jgi:hypothetical protein
MVRGHMVDLDSGDLGLNPGSATYYYLGQVTYSLVDSVSSFDKWDRGSSYAPQVGCDTQVRECLRHTLHEC